MYAGICNNLSQIENISDTVDEHICSWYTLLLATHAACAIVISFLIPYLGVTLCERMRDRGNDMLLTMDDLTKHSKAYRQLCLLNHSIPSRNCYPADIFNVHSSLLERCCKLRLSFGGGSITALPVIETVNSDISEYIATNVISITDGQLYTSKRLFLASIRPAIESGLSVSRIGSNAQCELMKIASKGLKNELTNLRLNASSNIELMSLTAIFCQDHLLISPLDQTITLLLLHKLGLRFNLNIDIHYVVMLMAEKFFYFSYSLFLGKTNYNDVTYNLLL